MKIASLRPTRFHESILNSLNSAVENHSIRGKIGYTAVAILTGSLATVERGGDVLLSLGRRALCLKNETPVTTKMQSLFKQSMGVLLSVLSPIFGCKYNASYQLNKSPDVPKTEKVATQFFPRASDAPVFIKELIIPDYILKELPTDENYLLTTVTEMSRPDNETYENAWPGLIRALKAHLKSAENAPVIVLFLFPNGMNSITGDKSKQNEIQSLKDQGLIRGYMEIHKEGDGFQWSGVNPEHENKTSLAKLKASLPNSID